MSEAVGKVAASGASAAGAYVRGGEHRRSVGFWVVWHLEGGFEGLRRWG